MTRTRRPFPFVATAAAACATACAPATRRAPAPAPPAPVAPTFPFGAEGRSDTVAPGVTHEAFVVRETDAHGRWAVHVLRAAAGACVSAIKAGDAAVGRATTSALVARLATRDSLRPVEVLGAVNADFFSFTPPGVPVAAHVEGGRVVAGPTQQPVFEVDSGGRPRIGRLVFSGYVQRGRVDTLPFTTWNRPVRDGVTAFDGGWGFRTDSVPGRLFVRLRPSRLFAEYKAAQNHARYRVVSVDSGAATALGPLAFVATVGPDAPSEVRARWAALRPGSLVDVAIGLFPVRPQEAVGGRPVLLRGGVVTPDVDTAGTATFRGVNPRTAVGITAGGGLLFVTVDGRQPGHSAGTTLRETAELLRALGAVDALNLDGGGSTTMVVRGPAGRVAVANRPSDAEGERPVANALALRTCAPAYPAVLRAP